MFQNSPIGIIGGSGLYDMEGLTDVEYRHIDTPFGSPSDAILTGAYQGIPVAFLTRHGRGHKLLPSEIPFRANIYALKSLGVKYILSMSAVGSLKAELKPRDFVVPDQFIDFTKHRIQTFFGEGVIAHVSMAQPICKAVSAALLEAIRIRKQQTTLNYHRGGTYLCIEGPQFSTQAESQWFASLGASVIGMTNLPEARLAREAQIAYSTLAMVTDYDAWNPKEAHVTADMAIENLMHNAENAIAVAQTAINIIHQQQPKSIAHDALASGLITPKDQIPKAKQTLIETLLQS
jgi:5'-methylthioadenosine phosphorylase